MGYRFDPVPAYLQSCLDILAPWLDAPHVTDIYINEPGALFAEHQSGHIEHHVVPALDQDTLIRLARQAAAYNNQGVSRSEPLLSGSLPGGQRIQVVLPPATRGSIAIAIRNHRSDFIPIDAFCTNVDQGHAATADARTQVERKISEGLYSEALALAVTHRMTILVSGGTSSGKTTLLNALIREVPSHERLIAIEDTAELVLPHVNSVGLLSPRGDLGEASVDFDDLLAASLRMRPDRIILGELRGKEAFTFLRAINTGHPGSMTTIHANSCADALEQMSLLALLAGHGLKRDDVMAYARQTIDLCVHVARTASGRSITQVALVQDLLS